MNALHTIERDLDAAEAPRRPGPREAIVTVTSLVKRYPRCDALQGVNLTIRRGDIFGLLGPNGAGKTTLTEIIEGIRPGTSGEVRVFDLDPAAQPRRLKEKIGVCLQHTALPRYLKVREAIELFASMYATRAFDAKQLLDRFQLTDKLDAFYRDLSGGQRQRLALGLALQHDPELVILDEPSAGLDPQARLEIHDLIADLRHRHKTVLLTTHYIEEADKLCDRVAIIDHGTIIAEGTPVDIRTRCLPPSKVRVVLSAPVPRAVIERLRALDMRVDQADRTLVIETRDPGMCVTKLASWLADSGQRIEDIDVARPTLEDAFIGLTGRKIRD